MGDLKQQFIKDKKGKKIAILLPIDEYNRMVDLLEEKDDLKEYRKAKNSKSELIPFEKAFKEIEEPE
jgi:hypothetical protein